MKKLLRLPLYPFFFCAYPVLYLASRNARFIAPADPLRPLLIALAGAAFLLLYFRLVTKEFHRAGLLAALFVGLFFSFGHAANALPGVDARALALVWLALLLGGALLLLRARGAQRAALPLNALSGALLVFALAGLVPPALARAAAPNDGVLLAEMRGQVAEAAAASTAPGPDIYYIVLDSYERADALQKYYHFDNSAFIHALEERGFTVADQSRSNYMTTAYALPAALNMVYLNDLPEDVFVRVTAGLKTNHVVDFLRARGYQVVHFESGFGVVDNAAYDRWASASGERVQSAPAVTQFELLLLQTSLGRLLFAPAENAGAGDEQVPQKMLAAAIQKDFDARRARLEYTFEHLADYAAAPGSNFLFAHIIAPHNPYLYGPNGERIDYNGNYFLLGDKSDPERNIDLYTGQLQYVNRRVLELLDRILAESDEPPVIILQADHGHDTYFEWDALTPEGVDLRSAILTAAYFPGGSPESPLYPSISPVNTFRVVFNRYFGARYPLLPDRTYSHPHPNAVPEGRKPLLVDVQPYLDRLDVP